MLGVVMVCDVFVIVILLLWENIVNIFSVIYYCSSVMRETVAINTNVCFPVAVRVQDITFLLTG